MASSWEQSAPPSEDLLIPFIVSKQAMPLIPEFVECIGLRSSIWNGPAGPAPYRHPGNAIARMRFCLFGETFGIFSGLSYLILEAVRWDTGRCYPFSSCRRLSRLVETLTGDFCDR